MNWSETLCGELVSLELFRICYSPFHKHRKLGRRAKKRVFIRYLEWSRGFEMFAKYPDRGMSEIKSRDVDFLENEVSSIGNMKKT